jgi:hypothetical protein
MGQIGNMRHPAENATAVIDVIVVSGTCRAARTWGSVNARNPPKKPKLAPDKPISQIGGTWRGKVCSPVFARKRKRGDSTLFPAAALLREEQLFAPTRILPWVGHLGSGARKVQLEPSKWIHMDGCLRKEDSQSSRIVRKLSEIAVVLVEFWCGSLM